MWCVCAVCGVRVCHVGEVAVVPDGCSGVNSDGLTLIIAFVRLGVLCVYVVV